MKAEIFKYLKIFGVLFFVSIIWGGDLVARIDSPKADIDVVFSEILYNSAYSGEDVGEWIELYNSTASAVNVGDWTIQDNFDTYTIPSCTVIPSDGYLVITSGRAYFNQQYGFNPHLSNLNLELSNVDDYLTLRDKQGNVRDQVAWESGGTNIPGWGSSSGPQASEGKSIVRSNLNQDTDTYADWANNQTPSPSSNTLPPGAPAIELSTTQLNFQAAVGCSPDPQSFTITNSGCETLNWQVTGDSSWMNCDPLSGSGSGTVTVTVDTDGLPEGTYTGTITISDPNASNSPRTISITLTVSGGCTPEIWLSRTRLNFGAAGGIVTCGEQAFLIENTGTGTLNWNADADAGWLACSPGSGENSGMVTVSLTSLSTGLAVGTYTGTVTVSDPNATNSPQTVSITLTVHAVDLPPFGTFATPVDNSIVRSSIPVTGWVLDDVGVESVKIYRHTGSGGGLAYVGDAVFVEGTRPDVEQAYPQYPLNYKAGWGYMLLTYFLSGEGDGTYVLEVIAADCAGTTVSLGTKTITVDNTNAVKPFGAIDTPVQGGSASGSDYRNHGWVLTPLPNNVPEDGSTINVYIDGVYLGHPVYNIYRNDIAERFPGYANSSGAHAYFDFDTTAYSNGVHTIYWTATDNGGNSDGIGSRYFSILNTGGAGRTESGRRMTEEKTLRSEMMLDRRKNPGPCKEGPRAAWRRMVHGYEQAIEPVYPGDDGGITIEIRELERVEIDFFSSTFNISPLPIGSTLDTRRGIFYWQPGPGFVGDYEFEFVKLEGTETKNVRIKIRILPKWSGSLAPQPFMHGQSFSHLRRAPQRDKKPVYLLNLSKDKRRNK